MTNKHYKYIAEGEL